MATKKPQDHQPKKPSVKKLKDGKQVTFSEITARDASGKIIEGEGGKPMPLSVIVANEAIDDFELLDDLNAMDVGGNASRMPSVLRRLIGDDYKPVLESLRDRKSGRVTLTEASAWINRLLEALNPNP